MELIVFFKLIIIFTCVQRIFELFVAKRNEKYILGLGGKIIEEKNYIFMVLLHTSWLVALIYLAFFQRSSLISPPLFYGSLVFFLLGQTLRLTAIWTLGKRWSTRIVVLPEAPVVKKGIFNFIRHPNYLGVIFEIAALPLMGGYFIFAMIFSVLNGVILFFRIREEEAMLCQFNDYKEKFLGEGHP
ncbi:MAG: hypothetical protein K9K67_15800 [Bacteriovoracaceae bacterium]|nr:hypothetical protein [Bacteriovoracaceae bacterium]